MVISDVSVENLSMRNSKNISSAPLSLIDINIYWYLNIVKLWIFVSTIRECLVVRKHTQLPFVLDEVGNFCFIFNEVDNIYFVFNEVGNFYFNLNFKFK